MFNKKFFANLSLSFFNMSVILFVCLKTIIFKELDKKKNDKVGKSFSLLNTSIPFQIDKFWVDYKKK